MLKGNHKESDKITINQKTKDFESYIVKSIRFSNNLLNNIDSILKTNPDKNYICFGLIYLIYRCPPSASE